MGKGAKSGAIVEPITFKEDITKPMPYAFIPLERFSTEESGVKNEDQAKSIYDKRKIFSLLLFTSLAALRVSNITGAC